MNNSISDNNESNMFVTLIVGILDLETGILKLCNAGHNPPILIYPDGQVSYLEFKTQIFVGVKVVVLTLGALGIATMWEAVFADVGVTLLAVLNAVRASNRRF